MDYFAIYVGMAVVCLAVVLAFAVRAVFRHVVADDDESARRFVENVRREEQRRCGK